MATEIMNILLEFIQGIFALFVSGATTLVSVFYDTTTNEFSIWGIFALLGLGIALAFFILRWITSLIRR